MSPVNRAGSVSEISPHHSFLRKKFHVFIREACMARLVTEIAVFATEISINGMKIFPYEHSSPGNRDETFQTKQLSQHSSQLAYFLSCMYFHFRRMQISFISKVTRIHKATTTENDTSLCPPFWFCFLNFIPIDRVEISHMNRQFQYIIAFTIIRTIHYYCYT